jgi:potassium-dependent mechanosensitive channel
MRAALRTFCLIAGLSLAAVMPTATPVFSQDAAAGVDYAGWEADAARAEAALTDGKAANKAFEQLRADVVAWREKFTAAQTANAARIDTLRNQIAAVGPAPVDGAGEAPQTAARREALNGQLAQLQAPGITASEALSRAEGIIGQIDRLIRDRQAKALLRLSPTPINPLNWPAGSAVLTQGMKTLWVETTEAWNNPARRTDLRNNLPLIFLYLALAAVLTLRGSDFMERQALRLQRVTSLRMRHALAAFVSLGQVAVPVIGTILLVLAIRASGMAGTRTSALIAALPSAAFSFFAARWLGSWLFPAEGGDADTAASHRIELTDRPTEGRFLAAMIGLLLAAEAFRQAFITEVRPPLSMAAQAVWAAPLVCIVALFLFRLGMLLRRGSQVRADLGEDLMFRNRLVTLTGTGAVVVAVVGPLMAVIGYVAAANALVWPAVMSLALIGLLILLQRFATDVYLAVMRSETNAREALIPVLSGIGLVFCALPVFALIWGARTTDLSEAWNTFRNGIAIGQTRISPTVLITFVALFLVGYLLTRLAQGALKTSVLPRTRLEKGAQNALTVGFGYLGIVLSAFVAINATGIDLSSLAIVAGALSVGIGFGLQNIVSNFVAGIILLIERPISEGDTIDVGGKQGVVKGISVRSTRLETPDRTYVIVPNADLVSGVVTNLTRFSVTGRLVMQVPVGYGCDTRAVQQMLMDICEAQPMVMIDPAPSVGFIGLTGGNLTFEIRVILADVNLKGDVQTEINHQIVERFAAEGIEIPVPQRDLWLRNAEALRPAQAAVPGRKAVSGSRVKPEPGLPRLGTDDAGVVNNDPDEGIEPDRR